MDAAKRTSLIEQIRRQQQTESAAPLVSLESFFDGNDDLGSIGCNLFEDHPGIPGFFSILDGIRSRPDVSEVLVEIYEIVEGDSYWPYSERVYVFTSMSCEEVERLLAPLHPSEVTKGWNEAPPTTLPARLRQDQPVAAWWD